jgi:hypothetical protein
MLQAWGFPQLHERDLEAKLYPTTLKTEAIYTTEQTTKPANGHDAN